MGAFRTVVTRLRLAPVALIVTVAPAHAGEPVVDLPAGTLANAVAALSAQAGVSVAVPDRSLWQRRVPAVRGRMSAKEALGRLLKGSGARAIPAGSRGWRIEVRPSTTAAIRAQPQPAASAQLPSVAESTPIVVTASKRDVPFNDYPGLVTRLDRVDLAPWARQGTDAVLAQTATLSSTHLGSGRNKLFIRGIADSSFTGPTQATVGQYLGDVRVSYNAPDPDLRLHDIDVVEVLEGPQGTLYGAGSLGGIVRIVRNVPDLERAGGSAEAGVSATRHGEPSLDAAGVLNLPIAPGRVGLRLVGYGSREGGYIDDTLRDLRDINRTRVLGGRASLRAEIAPGWRVDLGVTGQDTDGRDGQYADRDAPRLTRASRVGQGFDADYLLGDLVVTGEIGDARLTSSTALVRQRLTERYDASVSDGPDRLFVQRNRTNMVTHETRLSRPSSDGLGWVIGASLLHNRTELERALGDPSAPMPTTGVANTADEQTIFGEGSIALLPALILTAGGRLSHVSLGGGGENVLPQIAREGTAITARREEWSLLPSAAVNATPIAGVTLFARYQQGFRPGGLAIEAEFVRRFRNDRVATFEAGLRLGVPGETPFDVALGASLTRWRDIQADFIDGTGLPSTANIGNGRIRSLSAAAGWSPLAGLRLEAGAAVNDGKVDEPDLTLVQAVPLGRVGQIPNVADLVARGSIEYARDLGHAGTLSLGALARYTGKSRLGVGPVLGADQGAYWDTRLAARLGYDRWGLNLSIANLTDEIGNRFALGTPFSLDQADQITPLRPRTVRVGLDIAF